MITSLHFKNMGKNSLKYLALSSLIALLISACSSSSPSSTTVSLAKSQLEIRKDFATLFDLSNPSITPKVNVVQDGEKLRSAMNYGFHSSLAKLASGARVSSIAFLNGSECTSEALTSPCAKVTYYILGQNGSPVLGQASTGYAVELNGKWYVAKSVVCSLLGFIYTNSTPPGC